MDERQDRRGEVALQGAGRGGLPEVCFAGVHLFSPRLFPYFDAWPDKFSVIDFYLSVCDRGADLCLSFSRAKYWTGKQDALEKAEDFLTGECCQSR